MKKIILGTLFLISTIIVKAQDLIVHSKIEEAFEPVKGIAKFSTAFFVCIFLLILIRRIFFQKQLVQKSVNDKWLNLNHKPVQASLYDIEVRSNKSGQIKYFIKHSTNDQDWEDIYVAEELEGCRENLNRLQHIRDNSLEAFNISVMTIDQYIINDDQYASGEVIRSYESGNKDDEMIRNTNEYMNFKYLADN